jgi:alpha/beta superfamily hydrolase
MRGQFLERATVIPTPTGGVLEAVSHRGSRAPPLLVVPPPPGSGGMDHPVGAELAWACSRAGHATLRFNFRGVGASPGQPGGPAAQREDVEAALRALEENVGAASAAIACLGDSAVTGLALALSRPALLGLALISPGQLGQEALLGLRQPLLVVVGAAEPFPRAALAAAVAEAGGTLVVVPGADGRFQRNLPEVGQAVVRWLQGLSLNP